MISLPADTGGGAFECPLCAQAFAIGTDATATGAGPPSLGAAIPVPMHLPTKRWSGGAIALVTILVVVAAGGGLAILAMQSTTEAQNSTRDGEEWIDATKSGHTMEGITVRVQSVQVGPVRAKNADGTAFVSDREDYWTVRLRIRNGGEKPIEYRTWHAAEFPGGVLLAANLREDSGKRFVMQQFEDVALLQGQTLKKTLAPRESLFDVIVFEAPEGFERDQLKELRLELPGAACGIEGVFRQTIPKTLVE
jgi:hypothetical protein